MGRSLSSARPQTRLLAVPGGGFSFRSGSGVECWKMQSSQISVRTAAMASEKVKRVFLVPGGLEGIRASGEDVAGPQADEAVEPEQDRGGPFDGEVGPLPLGLDAEMGAGLLECDFDLPSSHEDTDDLLRLDSGVGAEEGLRLALAARVPGDGTHTIATGVMQSRGKPRPSDPSTRRVAALIPQDPNGHVRHDKLPTQSDSERPRFENGRIRFDNCLRNSIFRTEDFGKLLNRVNVQWKENGDLSGLYPGNPVVRTVLQPAAGSLEFPPGRPTYAVETHAPRSGRQARNDATRIGESEPWYSRRNSRRRSTSCGRMS